MPEEMVKMGSALPIPSCQVAHKACLDQQNPPLPVPYICFIKLS